MGSFRQNASHSNAQTPLLIVGGLLLLAALLAIFQLQLRKRRRQKYHAPLELQSNGVLGQIRRRKDDLNRFISTLRRQLAAREEQLRLHDELEGVVTARVQTSRQQDEEWEKIMRAGKKLHGKKWSRPVGDDQPSLKELMEMHKDELLEIKASMRVGESIRSSRREKRLAREQVMQLPRSSEMPTSVGTPAHVVSPQWQSTRRTAGSLEKSKVENTGRPVSLDEANVWSRKHFASPETASSVPVIPKLDLSRLGNSNLPSSEPAGKPKKSFEEVFAKQATLAKTLKQKKKT